MSTTITSYHFIELLKDTLPTFIQSSNHPDWIAFRSNFDSFNALDTSIRMRLSNFHKKEISRLASESQKQLPRLTSQSSLGETSGPPTSPETIAAFRGEVNAKLDLIINSFIKNLSAKGTTVNVPDKISNPKEKTLPAEIPKGRPSLESILAALPDGEPPNQTNSGAPQKLSDIIGPGLLS